MNYTQSDPLGPPSLQLREAAFTEEDLTDTLYVSELKKSSHSSGLRDRSVSLLAVQPATAAAHESHEFLFRACCCFPRAAAGPDSLGEAHSPVDPAVAVPHVRKATSPTLRTFLIRQSRD